MISPNDIIGCLIYRTAQALSSNQVFMRALKGYRFAPAIINDCQVNIWHFPGTQQEISQVFLALSKDSMNGAKLKFPAILSFQGVLQDHKKEITTNRHNLAIIAPVLSSWTTQEREEQAYRLVLRPIEEEFIRQVEKCEFLQVPAGNFPYISSYIPTTGNNLNSIMKVQYGDYMDVIEMPNFSINVLNVCQSKQKQIIEESKKVTDGIKNIVR